MARIWPRARRSTLQAGKTVLCHRRVWAGQGGAASESYLLPTSHLVRRRIWKWPCRGLPGFGTSGPTADTFTPDLSPQEILLPVMVVTPKDYCCRQGHEENGLGGVAREREVTARFLSVRIQARSRLFAESWPVVRIEVRAAGRFAQSRERVLRVSGSERRGGIAVLETEPAVTEVNTVALMLTGKAPSRGTLSIHVVDAATGVELKKLDNVEVSLAI